MPFEQAANLTSQYGSLVAHLNDPNRWRPGLEGTVCFSLPIERLPCSKERMHIAFAIYIAGLVVELAIGPSARMKTHLLSVRGRNPTQSLPEQLEFLLYLIRSCSGDLAWFVRQPVFNLRGPNRPKGIQDRFFSESVYEQWQTECFSRLETKSGLWPPPGIPKSELRHGLARYWHAIDALVTGLISDPILVAIRAT